MNSLTVCEYSLKCTFCKIKMVKVLFTIDNVSYNMLKSVCLIVQKIDLNIHTSLSMFH